MVYLFVTFEKGSKMCIPTKEENSNSYSPYQKTPLVLVMNFKAGAVGIEPTQEVLETPVLPLYDAPITALFLSCLINSFLYLFNR